MTAETSDGSLMGRLMRRLQGGPRDLELPVSAYGKLPIYKDFLRTRMTGRRAQELKAWLDRGVSHHWAVDPERRQRELGTNALLMSFPNTEGPLLGYLWGSHDDGGLRRFPFTLFVVPPPARGAFGQLSLLDALGQVAQGGAALRTAVGGLDSVDGFYRICRTAVIRVTLRPEQELEDTLRRELATFTIGELASSLYGDDAARHWPALLAYLERVRDGLATSQLALRLPLSPLLDEVQQVQLWLRLLGSRTGGRSAPVNVVLAMEGRAGGVAVLGRPPRPDDVFLLDADTTDYELVEDLRRAVPAPADGFVPPFADDAAPAATLLGPPASGG